ncbi:MAG: class I tRNA ligase family protein, partial [Erysipelotrichaceae bacterium]|nr:class I tRNA ligase family protein [Erysipelotrichaceae bacterium]
LQWLENIEDWCISRQLWWGHRIPVWYHNETGEIYCDYDPPKDIENYHQDEDVLDTWFSSALWPFATLGWPENTADMKRYYPTDCLVTGYDIIFFWVARMAFQARHFTDNYPFKHVLIHGLIRDEQGRKMSKSLGNGVDPIDVIEQYGADSLRFFLTTNSTPGADLRYSQTKIEAAWNFINKIYNASKYVEMNLDGFGIEDIDLSNLSCTDAWILNRENEVLREVNANMEKYEFAQVGNALYDFVWNDFCNWYIELAKSTLDSDDASIVRATKSTLLTVLTDIVKLLHPFMPFVTEHIYGTLPHGKAALCIESWPQVRDIDASKAFETDLLINIISKIREVRVDYNLKPSAEFDIMVTDLNNELIPTDLEFKKMLFKLCKVNQVEKMSGQLTVRPFANGNITLDLSQVIDFEAEKEKLQKEIARLQGEIKRSEGMLSNQNFISKAPEAKIAQEREKYESYKQQYENTVAQLKELNSK